MRSLILVLILASTAQAQFRRSGYYYTPQPQYQPVPQKPVSRLDTKLDGHDNYNSGDVADMPQGTDKLYMTLVTSDDWQTDQNQRGKAQRALQSWLQTDKRLVGYRSNAHFNWLTESDPAFTGARTLANGNASSLKARLGVAFPILAIEDASGEAYFKMSALSMPNSSGELADWITSSLKSKSVPVPKFSGQSQATPVVTEGFLGSIGLGGFGQCGPDGCPPYVPGPQPDTSEVIDDTPYNPLTANYGGLMVFGVLAAGATALGVTAIKRPGIKRQEFVQ